MNRKIVVVYKSDNKDLGQSLGILEARLETFKAKFIPREDITEKDTRNALVIIAGGDGTFVSTSHYIIDNYSIVLGTRLTNSSIGHYMEVDVMNLEEALNAIMYGEKNKDYKIERLNRLECIMHTEIGNWVKLPLALNEYMTSNTIQDHPTKYTLVYETRGTIKKEWQRSSGVVASTLHGYSGWAKHAFGGVTPKAHLKSQDSIYVVIREPMTKIEMHSLIITPGDKLKLISDTHVGQVVIDSWDRYNFNRDTEIEYRISDKPLNVVRLLGKKKWKVG